MDFFTFLTVTIVMASVIILFWLIIHLVKMAMDFNLRMAKIKHGYPLDDGGAAPPSAPPRDEYAADYEQAARLQ